MREKRTKRDLHALDENGMVVCNARDREAAHRAEVEGIATENYSAVTCPKCMRQLRRPGKARFVPLLLKALETDTSTAVRGQAAVALTELGGEMAMRGLLKLAAKPTLPLQVRKDVVYALAFIFEDGALSYLLESFSDKTEHPDIRAQCAEGIGNLLGDCDRRTKRWRRSVAILLPGLEDNCAEVRFWSTFALGQLRAKAALPALRKIEQNDATTMSSMGWELGEEARDAIAHILGKRLEEDAYSRHRANATH